MITGLSPMQTTLQECGASAAPCLAESPDQARASHGYPRAAALANAIRESKLDPMAISHLPEHSVGLFQLNMKRGLGAATLSRNYRTPRQTSPSSLNEARKFPTFASASTLLDAVGVFVRKVERPANTVGEINTRLKIAGSLVV